MTLSEALAWTDHCEGEVATPSPAPMDIDRDIALEQRSAEGLLRGVEERRNRSWLRRVWRLEDGGA